MPDRPEPIQLLAYLEAIHQEVTNEPKCNILVVATTVKAPGIKGANTVHKEPNHRYIDDDAIHAPIDVDANHALSVGVATTTAAAAAADIFNKFFV